MTPFRIVFCTFSLIALMGAGCSHQRKSIQIDFYEAVTRPYDEKSKNPALVSKKLEENLRRYPEFEPYVADIIFITEAEGFERKGDLPRARRSWFKALGSASGAPGKASFDGWIRTYLRTLPQKPDPVVFGRHILTETQNGGYSPFMIEKNLGQEKVLVDYLTLHFPGDLLLPGKPAPLEKDKEEIPPPPEGILPQKDPLLQAAAKIYFKIPKEKRTYWTAWIQSLPSPVRQYFEAQVELVAGRYKEAEPHFRNLYETLAQHPLTLGIAYESLSQTIRLMRERGERENVADLYFPLVKLWKRKDFHWAALGIEKKKFYWKNMDDVLAAARARALVGDYEHAKEFAQYVIDSRPKLLGLFPNLSSREQTEISNFVAEAYHLHGFRVAVEQKNYRLAVNLNLMALQIPSIGEDWQKRLKWFKGFYEYLDQKYESAGVTWENLLGDLKKEDSTRAMIYFWLAKSRMALGNKTEVERLYRQLLEEFPLSFYTVVAADDLGFEKQRWTLPFKNLKNMRDRLLVQISPATENPIFPKLEADREVERLFARIFILNQAASPWLPAAVEDLKKYLELKGALNQPMDPHLATKLASFYAVAGRYDEAIRLTSSASSSGVEFWKAWPEQIFIYFPHPYSNLYKQAGTNANVDVETLLALSRQESTFNPQLRSPSNAIGLMQLIPATAERLAVASHLPIAQPIEKELLNPPLNISLGGAYVKNLNQLFKGHPIAIFSAYNAGERAVALWFERRSHPDPFVFLELIPYNETRGYVKNVWRNFEVYKYLRSVKFSGTR